MQQRHFSQYGGQCKCTSLVEAVGFIPSVHSPVHSPWSKHPFTIYEDILGFHGKSRHSCVVSRALTEVVMVSPHSSFMAIYTNDYVDVIHNVASAAYHTPSESCSWSGRFDQAVLSTTSELSGIHAALHIATKPPNNWLLATDSRYAVQNILSSKGANTDLVLGKISLGRLLVSHGSNLRVQ
ncbi:hypothetical protein ISCGN_000418 [Ixodes scapularis]